MHIQLCFCADIFQSVFAHVSNIHSSLVNSNFPHQTSVQNGQAGTHAKGAAFETHWLGGGGNTPCPARDPWDKRVNIMIRGLYVQK